MDPVILAAIIGGIFVIIAAVIPTLFEWLKERRLAKMKGSTKLADSFALAYSLIGYVAAEENTNLSVQRSQCLEGLQQASKNLGINVSEITNKMGPLDKFLSKSNVIPTLRSRIRKRYGIKASSAFEMGIWLAVALLSDKEGRQKALDHAKWHAQKIGLNADYVTNFFRNVQEIQNRLDFANEVTRFISETVKRLDDI